jgi:hypothetical protein
MNLAKPLFYCSSDRVVEIQSSILAGPAEDVVEKWPWLKTAEHNLSYTLFHARKEAPKKMSLKKRV